jgi:hypothetical protein
MNTLYLLVHSKTAWDDYFSGTTPTNYNSQLYTSGQNPSDTYVYISNCLFKSIMSSICGGALYCSSVKYFLVESTSFFSCKTSSCAAAIHFSNSNGQCVLYKVCVNDCCSTSGSMTQALLISVNNGISSKNYINYSSVARSVNEVSNSIDPVRIFSGKICFPSFNISMNKCYYQSAVMCGSYVDSNSATCLLSYSTFADNNAIGYTCISFNRADAKYEIKSCNILRNTQSTLDTQGTIYTYGNLNIYDSCILENTANKIFCSSSSSYKITLSNCTADSFSNNGYLTTQNTVTKSFILALNHMSTQNCNSDYDSAGTLTPIVQTPSSSKNQKHCYTGERFLYQPPQGNLVSLTSVLVLAFNFIYPYASNDYCY